MDIAEAIAETLSSPNVVDSNFETANVVDVINDLSLAAWGVARSITPNAAPGTDETGGRIESLTEAVMGVTAGLCMIASSIDSLAEAIRERPA